MLKNQAIKNILIVTLSLIGIMLISTLFVLGFNNLLGLSTDINNHDVSTAIAGIAFIIAIIWRYLYEIK